MKKTILFLLTVLIGQFVVAENNIPLVGDYPGLDPEDEPRSSIVNVTASIESQVVTVSFNDLTTSQIVVTDSSNQTVYNQMYSASYSVQADLTSLPTGNYTLHIYAYGEWWYGYFNL